MMEMDVRHTRQLVQKPKITSDDIPGALIRIVVENHSIIPKNSTQSKEENLGKRYYKPFLCPLNSRLWKLDEVNRYLLERDAHGIRVDPTDSEAHEQNYIVFQTVAHSLRFLEVWCILSVGDVDLDMTTFRTCLLGSERSPRGARGN